MAYTYIKGYAGSTAVPCGYIRQGYQFDSWNTKADGSGKSYAAGSYIGDLKPGTVLYAQWSYSYMAKVNEFINIPEYQNGKIWNDNTYNKMSSWSSSGCCAYAYDFAKYVYGIDGDLNKAASWISSSPTEIQTGDIIYSSTKGHWFVVLERTGNTLYTAEGNVSGKVRICNDVYSITETGSINDKWNGDFGGLTIYHFNF